MRTGTGPPQTEACHSPTGAAISTGLSSNRVTGVIDRPDA
jgi:hypothetical protein